MLSERTTHLYQLPLEGAGFHSEWFMEGNRNLFEWITKSILLLLLLFARSECLVLCERKVVDDTSIKRRNGIKQK